jgi:hypothetical protein
MLFEVWYVYVNLLGYMELQGESILYLDGIRSLSYSFFSFWMIQYADDSNVISFLSNCIRSEFMVIVAFDFLEQCFTI